MTERIKCTDPRHPTEPVFGVPNCPSCGGPGPRPAEDNRAKLQEMLDRTMVNPLRVGVPEALTEAELRRELGISPVEFDEWWTKLVATEAPTIAAKAREYGSNSLAAMGRLYARGQGREVEPAEALELGCFVYAYGKMQRVADAMIRGVAPSVDTLRDLMIYAAMAQFIRQYGQWP
jgi:hypothetical protein